MDEPVTPTPLDDAVNTLKELRKKAELSVPELAHKAGLSPASLYLIEGRKNQMTRYTAEKLAVAFGVPVATFVLPASAFGKSTAEEHVQSNSYKISAEELKERQAYEADKPF